MKSIRTIILTCMFFVTLGYAGGGDNSKLQIERDGDLIHVINFKEGDKIKLFEVSSGEHILSKTRGEIDLSQLPVGAYLLENSEGKSVVIHKRALVRVMLTALGGEHRVARDSPRRKHSASLNTIEDLKNHYIKMEGRLLGIERRGDRVTVIDFEEGDIIKLFELKDKVHIITKSSPSLDLSQLPMGVYLLENTRGQAIVLKKSTATVLF